jgi:hypothetical protein
MDHLPGRLRGRVIGRLRDRLPLPLGSLVVPVIAGLGAVVFLAWKPGVARSLLGSPRAAAFGLAVGVVVVGAGWLLPRLGRGARSTAVVQAVPVALAFTLTVLPAFGDTVVRDDFPAVAGSSATAGPSAASPTPNTPASEAEVVSRGTFAGIDHRASGDVLLVVPANGPAVVRLESLDVEAGPDYVVDLVPRAGATTPDGGVRLDRLRGNRGDQNYPVPAGTPLDRPLTVLIWCRAFAVPVAAATLS